MPRKARSKHGGPRQGTPGASYQNRQDLNEKPRQAIQTAGGQEYGARTAQAQAQQALPMPAQAPPRPMGAPAAAPPADPNAPAYTGADAVPTFGTPTSRPDEPVEAGMPFGPGRTPPPDQGLRAQPDPATEDLVDQLRALYAMYPTREIRELLEEVGF
jgi:hypothetical protein